MQSREIRRVWTVKPEQANPIHKVGVVLEPGNWEEFDPFLMLAEDWFQEGVFDFHPHRGIETVTFVIEGVLEHYDNNAGNGSLTAGGAQWMTAGRGVIHKETAPLGQQVHTLQLWINLKSNDKMTEPRYQNLQGHEMPLRQEKGTKVRVFSGVSGEAKASTKNHVPVTMVEMWLEPGASISQSLPGSYNGFVYILEGEGVFGTTHKTEGKQKQVLWLGSTADAQAESEITIQATANSSLHLLLYAGEPVREPVVAYGPFVMNTQQQIMQAFSDYRAGKFTNPNDTRTLAGNSIG